jgi:hypothetical protein
VIEVSLTVLQLTEKTAEKKTAQIAEKVYWA